MLFLSAHSTSWVAVVSHNTALVKEIDLSQSRMAALVQNLRTATDPDAIFRGSKSIPDPSAPFPVRDAYELYRFLLGPVADVLADSESILVVPDGPITALPFSILVEKEPPLINDARDYRKVSWLASKFPITVLPDVYGLSAPQQSRRSQAPKPFFAVADPTLPTTGRPEHWPGFLKPLPETRLEIEEMAELLGADLEKDALLGLQATEVALKSKALHEYRVLTFATHGLTAEESGLDQPALVLTPPRGKSAEDGLLTAAEVAELTLDAEWVILSACNTGESASSKSGEWLSGLASSFFIAGARSLFVAPRYLVWVTFPQERPVVVDKTPKLQVLWTSLRVFFVNGVARPVVCCSGFYLKNSCLSC